MKINQGPRKAVRLDQCRSGDCVEYEGEFYVVTLCDLLCEPMDALCIGINLENGQIISTPDLIVTPVDAEINILS
jgi:hypothetical protein